MRLGPHMGQVSPQRGNICLFGQTCRVRVVLRSQACSGPPLGGRGEEKGCRKQGWGRGGGGGSALKAKGGGRAWGREEQSRDRQEDRFQRLGFIVQYSFSSVRRHKLGWHYTRSQDGEEPPGAELAAGKSHPSRHVHLWVSPHGQPQAPERSLRRQASGAGAYLKARALLGEDGRASWGNTWAELCVAQPGAPPDLLPPGLSSGSS